MSSSTLPRVAGRFAPAAVAPLLLAIAVVGCKKAELPAVKAPPPPEVIVTTPTTADITDFEEFTGRTVARRTIEIRARVTGYLEQINFKDGGDVKQGDVLFEINPRAYKAELTRAQATLLQAEAHLKRLDRDLERATNLINSKSISREQFDLVSGDRAEAEAAVRVAKATIVIAQTNLDYCQVKAPVSGQISRTMLDVGNLVRADESVLTTLVTLDPIYAYFEIDERTLLLLRRIAEQGKFVMGHEQQLPVYLGLADEDSYPRQGSINFLDNRLDTATGTLQVRGVFPNPNHVLAPGMFVRVRLPIGTPYRAVMIDEQALGTDQGQKFVYVVDQDNKAQYRRVQVGKLQAGRRVVTQGLTGGERVVLSGLQRVRPGAPVNAKPLAESASAAQGGVAQADAASGKLAH